jgi:ATP-binding cassette, subfamily B (MDR/TAP), member 1
MDCADRTKFYLGLLSALVFGGSMPAFCLIFGDMIDSVGSSDGSDSDSFKSLQTQAVYMVYIGLVVWISSWFQVTMLSLFSESISFKIKVEYFKKCLEKDAAYYDI